MAGPPPVVVEDVLAPESCVGDCHDRKIDSHQDIRDAQVGDEQTMGLEQELSVPGESVEERDDVAQEGGRSNQPQQTRRGSSLTRSSQEETISSVGKW